MASESTTIAISTANTIILMRGDHAHHDTIILLLIHTICITADATPKTTAPVTIAIAITATTTSAPTNGGSSGTEKTHVRRRP